MGVSTDKEMSSNSLLDVQQVWVEILRNRTTEAATVNVGYWMAHNTKRIMSEVEDLKYNFNSRRVRKKPNFQKSFS